MGLVGKDGKPIDLSKATLVGEEINEYKIDEIAIQTTDTPGVVFSKAQAQVKGLLQQQGQFAAASNANPFAFEPAALGVFMLLCNEIKRLEKKIDQIKEGNTDGEQD